MNLRVDGISWHTPVSSILVDQPSRFDCNGLNEFPWSYCTAALTDRLWFSLAYKLADLVMSSLSMSILAIQLNYYVKTLLLIISNLWSSSYNPTIYLAIPTFDNSSHRTSTMLMCPLTRINHDLLPYHRLAVSPSHCRSYAYPTY